MTESMPTWIDLTTLACGRFDAAQVVCLTADHQHLTRAQWLTRVDDWQGALSKSAQRQWAIYCDDPFEFSAALYGAWHAGKEVILIGDQLGETLAAMVKSGYGLAGDMSGAQIANPPRGLMTPTRVPLQSALTRLRLYTSGSQGQPVAIEKRLDQLASEVETLNLSFGDRLPADPVVYSTVSHQHIYGLLFLVLWPLAAGHPFAQKRMTYPEDMAMSLGPGASVLIASPAHLSRLGQTVDWSQARTGLRAVFSSGGPLSFDVSAAVAEQLGSIPIEVFGSTETGGIAWRQCATLAQPWKLFSGVQCRLDNGCLSVSSPRLPDSDWWTTSDLVEPVGTDGFRLLGRADRIVKIEEKRVSLGAVENHLLQSPWVQEVRAIVLDTAVGQRVCVVAVLNSAGQTVLDSGRRVLIQQLRLFLQDRLEAIGRPKRWRFVSNLPVNTQGKVTQNLLASLFDDAPHGPPDQLFDRFGLAPHLPPFRWCEQASHRCLVELDIRHDLTVFRGHFDRTPILPGVAQLDWAIELGRASFDLPPRFLRLEALKFVRPVLPGTRLLLELVYSPKSPPSTDAALNFRYCSVSSVTGEQVVHASGRALWTQATKADDHD